MVLAEIARLSGYSDWIDLDFVERERTPIKLMELGIRLHLSGLSLSNTVSEVEEFGVERSRKAVHDWVQKADLQPASDASPDYTALAETVIRINGQLFWLYAAVDSETNEFLHLRLFTTTTTTLTQQFLRELREKHDVEDVPRNLRFLVCERDALHLVNAVFLVNHAAHLAAALHHAGLRFQTVRHGNRNAVERICRELKRCTSSFSNSFSNVDPETAETWLQAFAVWWNSLN